MDIVRAWPVSVCAGCFKNIRYYFMDMVVGIFSDLDADRTRCKLARFPNCDIYC